MGNEENMVNDLSEETMEEGAVKEGKLIRSMSIYEDSGAAFCNDIMKRRTSSLNLNIR